MADKKTNRKPIDPPTDEWDEFDDMSVPPWDEDDIERWIDYD